jgi:ribosomal protein L40E
MIRDCRLVTSRITGLGKSSAIRQAIKLSRKNYVKFSISGDFDVDTLAERLSSKCSQLQGAAVHLDIGIIDNSQQLNEILYCLLLFGSFRFGQVAVSIPANTAIYIELDASPQSTLTEISFFQHIKQSNRIDRMDWTTLDVGRVEIRTVANYLQAIVNGDIVKKNIDPATFSQLGIATCSRLIQDHFLQKKDADFITWTQLSIFIAIFYRLFTCFSRCGYFLVKYVPYPQLRMDLIQTLLQSSNQFTSLSVGAVRKQQRSVPTDELVAFSDAIIRWDKIQPFTLIFTATDEPLFVYKKSSDVPRALIEYFKLYYKATGQKQEMSEETMFPDYTKLSHTAFFIKLALLSRKYVNKSICPRCYRQFEFREQHCQQCPTKDVLIRPQSFDDLHTTPFQIGIAEQLQNEYILTADNFVKMLLIYMRVQSNIPVLIMGETGKII